MRGRTGEKMAALLGSHRPRILDGAWRLFDHVLKPQEHESQQ